ncbi:MAG: PAS-domain containing protein, partial [Rhizobiaceae bacterium]
MPGVYFPQCSFAAGQNMVDAMSGTILDIEKAGFGRRPARYFRKPLSSLACKSSLRLLAILTAILIAPAFAFAAANDPVPYRPFILSFSTTDTILLAVFGGAMSFAILSAVWMIRERGSLNESNQQFRQRLSDLRATNERLEALVNVSDQRTVVWEGSDSRPEVLGALSKSSGAPIDRQDFLAFGRWLTPDSAINFENALSKLRGNAEAFDLPLITHIGGVLEAQGRTSGSHALVRFVELTGERSALSQLETEHARLNATFGTLQSLFQTIGSPVWLRDSAGNLFWTNNAYAQAVDCKDGAEAVERGVELLDSAQRRSVSRVQDADGSYSGSLPAVIAGDRRILEVAETRNEAGSAGIALDRNDIEDIKAILRRTTETHAQTLDHLATAIAMFDGGQRLQFYNSSFQKLWGLEPAFLSSKPTNSEVLDAIRASNRLPDFPDWRKWCEDQLEIYKAVDTREDWWHLPSGETLRVVCNPHSQGGATWVFENVTEHLALQSNYNSLMKMQGETLDKLSEAIAVFGQDGKLKLYNPAFARFWAMDSEELDKGVHISVLNQQSASRLTDTAKWDEISEAITGLYDVRDDMTGRLEIDGGEIFDFRLIRLPEGQTMLAMADITASVNVERVLKERNEALEQADHLKNRFIQHVSYELRAPLTSISGFSELLGDSQIGSLNQKQSEYVGHVTSSADTLKAVIDDI